MSEQHVVWKRSWASRMVERLAASRRRAGTVAAIGVAILLAYQVVAGSNGLTAFKQKMVEDKRLAVEVQQMQKENERLQKHVDHLASDPDAIEYEAHTRLRYTKPDQIIVLNDDPAARDSHAAASK